jgi:hypothetical protein
MDATRLERLLQARRAYTETARYLRTDAAVAIDRAESAVAAPTRHGFAQRGSS